MLVSDAGYFSAGMAGSFEPASGAVGVHAQRLLSARCRRATAPPADPGQRVVLDVGRRRPPAHPGLRATAARSCTRRCRSARRAAAATWAPREVSGRGHRRRLHRQRPPVAARRSSRRTSSPTSPSTRTRPSASPPTSSGASPTTCTSAMRVAVRFEQHDDVWLPLFEPTGETDADRPGRRAAPCRRPGRRSSADRFEHRSVLSGVGRSAHGPAAACVDPLSLAVDACLAAVADAGLDARRHRRPVDLPGRGRHGHERGRRHRRRGGAAHPADVDQRRRRAARPGRLGDRRDAGGGQRPVPPRPVLPHGVGVDLRHAAASAAAGGGGRVSGAMHEWRAPFGAMSAANWIGMNANQYLHRYGATREMLGCIALNGRANAARNPAAIYRDPMTMDDYLSARPITSPFGLYDCDVPCDASIAVIVSDASVAADLPKPADPHRRRRHADHRAHLVGPGHRHPRAAGARPVRPPLDAHQPAPGRRRPRPRLRRLHVQRHLVARGPRLLRLRRGQGLARRRPPHRPRRRAAR